MLRDDRNSNHTERAIPPGLDPAVVAGIDARLDSIEREHGVAILFAIESGSRAWGFPSPDSDYDCRFVFVRPQSDYLTLFPKRDVIETELTPVFDVNGWDIGKALKLLIKGNAVIIEWLMSPIVYRAKPGFRSRFLALADEVADRQSIARHYLHLGNRIVKERIGDPEDVALKKLFYALRPAIALRWLRLHPNARIAPMSFPQLCAEADLAPDLAACIERMLVEKAATRELGRGPAPRVIMEAVTSELSEAETVFAKAVPPAARARELADAFFRQSMSA